MPQVRAGLVLPGITTAEATIAFLVDTGAMVSSVSPHTALAAGVRLTWFASPAQVLREEGVGGVGGALGRYVVAAQYVFTHEDGSAQTIEDELDIAKWDPGAAQTPPRLPPLLGWNVLEHFQLTTNYRTRTVTLE